MLEGTFLNLRADFSAFQTILKHIFQKSATVVGGRLQTCRCLCQGSTNINRMETLNGHQEYFQDSLEHQKRINGHPNDPNGQPFPSMEELEKELQHAPSSKARHYTKTRPI
jgi:hypothetical protein